MVHRFRKRQNFSLAELMSTVMTNKFLSTFGPLLFTIIIIIIWIVDLAIFYFQDKEQNLIFSKVSIALYV